MKPWMLRYLLHLWPPYWGSGIRVMSTAADWRRIEVALPLRWYNKNYVGTHFGGSLFAMTDPFYMLMLMHILGPQYYVWDKAGAIEFIQPGRGRVHAVFEVGDALLDEIRRATDGGEKYFRDLEVFIRNTAGEPVARVVRTLYIRKKPAYRRPG
jgi:acyl-coenzyme A thioesterase PaaI-like protein